MCQNVSNEVLSIWFKLQAKLLTRSGVSRESDKNTPAPPTPLSKDGGLKDSGHSTSIGKLIFVANSVMFSYLIRHYTKNKVFH